MFKVAKVRSVKLKAKAQKVMTNLKKLEAKEKKVAVGRKDKTAQIDEQLQELRKEMQAKPKVKQNSSQKGKKKKTQAKPPVQTDAATSLIGKMRIEK